jgi:hypothetical protein
LLDGDLIAERFGLALEAAGAVLDRVGPVLSKLSSGDK